MDQIDEAIEYILSDTPPDGTFKEEALEMHHELQHRKIIREKKHKQDFDDYKVGVVAKAVKRKHNKRGMKRIS